MSGLESLPVPAPAAAVLSSLLRIALILGMALVARRLARRLVPRMVRLATRGHRGGHAAAIDPEEHAKRVGTLSHVALRTADVLLSIAGGFMLLAELGLNIAPILAGAGVVGIAVGFGAQALVRDVLNGVFVLIENQYGRGDVVRIAGIAGVVEDVNLRRTVLRDLDGVVHSVPNGEVRVVSNMTRDWSGVNLNVSVGYGEDLERVRRVLDRVGDEMTSDPDWAPLILEPPRVLRVDAFEESGVALKILARTRPMKQWDVTGELRRRIKSTFDAEGIKMPLPHRVVVQAPPAAPDRRPEAAAAGQGRHRSDGR